MNIILEKLSKVDKDAQVNRLIKYYKLCKSARYGDDITEFKYCILPATNYFENVNRELIYAIVCEHNYNPEKSNEDKRKYVEDLLSKLHDIVSWK